MVCSSTHISLLGLGAELSSIRARDEMGWHGPGEGAWGTNPEMGAVLQTGGLLTGSGQCGLLNSYVYCFYLTSLMVFFN